MSPFVLTWRETEITDIGLEEISKSKEETTLQLAQKSGWSIRTRSTYVFDTLIISCSLQSLPTSTVSLEPRELSPGVMFLPTPLPVYLSSGVVVTPKNQVLPGEISLGTPLLEFPFPEYPLRVIRHRAGLFESLFDRPPKMYAVGLWSTGWCRGKIIPVGQITTFEINEVFTSWLTTSVDNSPWQFHTDRLSRILFF